MCVFSDWRICVGNEIPGTPVPVLRNPDLFATLMVRQLSQVFLWATTENAPMPLSTAAQAQISVLSKVLAIFRCLLPRYSSHDCVVESALRVIIGVADAMLCHASGTYPLCDALRHDVLATVFEVWIKACGTPAAVLAEKEDSSNWLRSWDILRTHIRRWRHHVDTVRWWFSAVSPATRRVASILVGDGTNCDGIGALGQSAATAKATTATANMTTTSDVLTMGGGLGTATPTTTSAQLLPYSPLSNIREGKEGKLATPVLDIEDILKNMPPLLVSATWYRLLFLLGPPNGDDTAPAPAPRRRRLTPMPPAVHKEAMISLARVVDALLINGRPGAPHGRSLLRLLGRPLFAAADPSTGPEYSAGRALAVGALCAIFSAPQRTNTFAPQDLNYFYFAVIEALQRPIEAERVLMSTQGLFIQDLNGVLSLTLPLLGALRRVLCAPAAGSTPRLRAAATHHLVTLVCFPDHFSELPLQAAVKPGSQVLYFASIKYRLFDIFLGALAFATDAVNVCAILRALTVFVLDDEARRVVARHADATKKDMPTSPATASPVSTKGPPAAASGPSLIGSHVIGDIQDKKDHTQTLASATKLTTNGASTTSTASTATATATKAVATPTPTPTSTSTTNANANASSTKVSTSGSKFVRQKSKSLRRRRSPDESTSSIVSSAASQIPQQPLRRPRAAPPQLPVSRAIEAVLGRLLSLEWTLSPTLAALETLASFVHLLPVIRRAGSEAGLVVIRGLCRYIIAQVYQPDRRHTRSLHSMIVGAYHCLAHWVASNPDARSSQDCLRLVLRVATLGLVGTGHFVRPLSEDDKAPSRLPGDSDWSLHKNGPRRKAKSVRSTPASGTGPVSFRVQAAASLLLRCVCATTMPSNGTGKLTYEEREGNTSHWHGGMMTGDSAASQGAAAREARLLETLSTSQQQRALLRHFVVDGHTILTVIEGDKVGIDGTPMATFILRDDSGRHVWYMRSVLHLDNSGVDGVGGDSVSSNSSNSELLSLSSTVAGASAQTSGGGDGSGSNPNSSASTKDGNVMTATTTTTTTKPIPSSKNIGNARLLPKLWREFARTCQLQAHLEPKTGVVDSGDGGSGYTAALSTETVSLRAKAELADGNNIGPAPMASARLAPLHTSVSRALLAQLGFCHPTIPKGRLAELVQFGGGSSSSKDGGNTGPHSGSSRSDPESFLLLLSSLKALDAMPQYHRHELALLCADANGQLVPREALDGQPGILSFLGLYHDLRFLHPIGYQRAGVDFRAAQHRPAKPLLLSQTIELVVTLGPLRDESPEHPPLQQPQQQRRQRQQQKRQKQHVVVWVEHPDHCENVRLPDGRSEFLLVAPLHNGLFIVHSGPVLAGDEHEWRDSMVLSERTLASYLRLGTLAHANQANFGDEHYLPPHLARTRAIERMATLNANQDLGGAPPRATNSSSSTTSKTAAANAGSDGGGGGRVNVTDQTTFALDTHRILALLSQQQEETAFATTAVAAATSSSC